MGLISGYLTKAYTKIISTIDVTTMKKSNLYKKKETYSINFKYNSKNQVQISLKSLQE